MNDEQDTAGTAGTEGKELESQAKEESAELAVASEDGADTNAETASEPQAPRTARGLITDFAAPQRQAPQAPKDEPVTLDADTLSEINDVREAAGEAAAKLFQRQAEKAARLERQVKSLDGRTSQVSDQSRQAADRHVHALINDNVDRVVAAEPELVKLIGSSWEECSDDQAKTRVKIGRIASGIKNGDPTMTDAEAIEQATRIATSRSANTKSSAVQQVNSKVQRAAQRQTTPPTQRTGKAPAANQDPRAAAVARLDERMRKAGLGK